MSMAVQVSAQMPQVHETTIKLLSLNGLEVRRYKIDFFCDSSATTVDKTRKQRGKK